MRRDKTLAIFSGLYNDRRPSPGHLRQAQIEKAAEVS